MSWVKLDDLLPHHDKLIAAGTDALAVFGLYVASLCYAQRHDTDGRISRPALALLMPGCPRPSKRLLAQMVTLKLWDADGVDWRIHDYLDHNLSAVERAAGKRANNVRQHRRRERIQATLDEVRDAQRDSRRESHRDSRVTHDVVTGPSPVPSRPVPNPSLPVPVSQRDTEGLSATSAGPDSAGPEPLAAIMARREDLRRARGYVP